MLEARITKLAVVQDQKDGKTVLMGVAEFFDESVNFKVKYDWETLDRDGFVKDLRGQLAKDFDLPSYRIDVNEKKLLDKMCLYSIAMKNQRA